MQPVVSIALVLGLLPIGALASGCDRSADTAEAEQPPPPVTVPPARTRQEWATRLVNRFLRDVDEDLRVLNALREPTARTSLYSGKRDSVRVVTRTMTDLRTCSRKLDLVGPAPSGAEPAARVYASFRQACPHYERVAELLLEAVPLLASEDPADKRDGREILAAVTAPSRAGAEHFGNGLALIEQHDLLRGVRVTPLAAP